MLKARRENRLPHRYNIAARAGAPNDVAEKSVKINEADPTQDEDETGDNFELTPYEAIEKAAKNLLEESKSIKTKITKKGTASLNSQTCDLLQQIYNLQAILPLELLTLIAHRLDVSADPFIEGIPGVQVNNPEAWKRAIFFESGHPPDQKGKNPSAATVNAIARAAFPNTHEKGSDHRRTISNWRKVEKYRYEVSLYRGIRSVIEKLSS